MCRLERKEIQMEKEKMQLLQTPEEIHPSELMIGVASQSEEETVDLLLCNSSYVRFSMSSLLDARITTAMQNLQSVTSFV